MNAAERSCVEGPMRIALHLSPAGLVGSLRALALAARALLEDSAGPVALIDSLKSDLEKDIQEGEFNEKQSQEDYEEARPRAWRFGCDTCTGQCAVGCSLWRSHRSLQY